MKKEIGDKIGRLTILKRVENNKNGGIVFECLCECGTIKNISKADIGRSVHSCGCIKKEMTTSHGMSYHPLFQTWKGMVGRCYNKKHHNYSRYGARGIEVYEPWKNNPKEFIDYVEKHLGEKMEGYSIDRVNNNGNYEPNNIRWATIISQSQNRRTNKPKEDMFIMKRKSGRFRVSIKRKNFKRDDHFDTIEEARIVRDLWLKEYEKLS